MDPTSVTPNKKLKKLEDGEKGEGQIEKNISDLPQELISEILSGLATKEAVGASLVSKGWQNLWKDISKIKLDEDSHGTRQQFIEFVENIVNNCTKVSCLRKFSLEFDVNNEASRLNEWLSVFINPKIEELSLLLDRVRVPPFIPEHLFENANLTKLEICMISVMDIPTTVYLKALKVLSLKYVMFRDGASAQNLFSGCPILEELTLTDCVWTHARTAIIACPELRKLTIREWSDDDETYNSYSKIVIIGPSITKFAYNGDLINEYHLYCTDKVRDASIEAFHPEDFPRDAGYCVYMMMRSVTTAQSLRITNRTAHALSSTRCALVKVPLFNRLEKLRVSSLHPMDFSCASLFTLFRNSPCLESIVFASGVSLSENEQDGEFSIDPLPSCFGTHLKTIFINGFRCTVAELKAIKYFLKVTPVLEMLHVYSDDLPYEEEDINSLYDLVEGFPTASPNCALYLE